MSGALALPPGYRLIARETVASTNDEVRALAEAGAPDGVLVWARSQSAGRGRRGRPWVSPPGNLYLSLLLRPSCGPAQAAQLSFVAALALCDALEGTAPGIAVSCKWPNDVLVERRKLAGILLESASDAAGRLDWLVVGLGVNVASHPALEEASAQPATSLKAHGASPPLERLIEGFAHAFERRLSEWRSLGFAPVREAWLARAAGLNEALEVALEGERVSGVFRDLTDTGELVISLPGGALRRIGAGDVRLVRAT